MKTMPPRRKKRKRKGQPLVEKALSKSVPTELSTAERPENYPSLIQYLEATNQVKHLTTAQQYRARQMFIRGKALPEIAEDTGMLPSVVQRLAVINGWDEERDKRLLNAFRRVNKLSDGLAPRTNERHDRIAGTIESLAERLLHQSQDGGDTMGVADLKRLADLLKTTVDIRQGLRGNKAVQRHSHDHNHTIEPPGEQTQEQFADALSGCITDGKKGIQKTHGGHELVVQVGDVVGSDEEYE